MQCIKPVNISFKNHKNYKKFPDGLSVPCGKCLMCRMKRREEWSLRLIHELTYNNDAMFITLTYNEENMPLANHPYNELAKEMELPYMGTLKKTDLQKFFKRLRKDISVKIKYFACGEYGFDTHRPHYHIILFGLPLNDSSKKLIIDNWNKCDWNPYRIKNAFGQVEYHSCRYVAKYVMKEMSGEEEKRIYTNTGRENVFRLMSNGIGRDFALKNKSQLIKDLTCKLRGVNHSIPRYYLKLFNLSDDVTCKLKENAYINECSRVGKIIGIDMSEEMLYLTNNINNKDKIKYLKEKERVKQQVSKNINARNQLIRDTL